MFSCHLLITFLPVYLSPFPSLTSLSLCLPSIYLSSLSLIPPLIHVSLPSLTSSLSFLLSIISLSLSLPLSIPPLFPHTPSLSLPSLSLSISLSLSLPNPPVPWPQWAWFSGLAPPWCRCPGSESSQTLSPGPPAAPRWRTFDSSAACVWAPGRALTRSQTHLGIHRMKIYRNVLRRAISSGVVKALQWVLTVTNHCAFLSWQVKRMIQGLFDNWLHIP